MEWGIGDIMKRKRNIEYSNKPWNPYTGCMNWKPGIHYNGCKICNLGKDCWFYGMAQRLRGRFGYDSEDPTKPTFHIDKLFQPHDRSKPTIYATCFMGDIGYCPYEYFRKIIMVMGSASQHTYIMLTKMPWVLKEYRFVWPENVWLGVSVTDMNYVGLIEQLKGISVNNKFVSFEPMKGPITANLEGIDGIAIGGKTGPHGFQPEKTHIKQLLIYARAYDCKVVIKENLDFYPKLIEWP